MTFCNCGPFSNRRGNRRYRDAPRYRILITNGRFPVSLDLARQLHTAGHHVFCVDPMEYHVCKFSISVHTSRQVPAPHVDGKGYVQAVKDAIERWKIDLVIPLHEEIFFLAACGEKEILDRLFAPRWSTLVRLHNKWEYTKMMRRFGLGVPEARLLKSMEDLKSLNRDKEWAVKPVFGRASTNVYHLKPGGPIPDDLSIEDENHYIAQEWTMGDRFCSYTVIRDGRIMAHGVYPVIETIDGSSSVYFKQINHPGIKEYVERFAKCIPDFTGQAAFDFVQTKDGKLVTMECNPRCTSGVHLWSDTPLLARALTDTLQEGDASSAGFTEPPPTAVTGRPARRQVTPGMMMWEHEKTSARRWLRHMGRLLATRDVTWSWLDLMPSLMQPFLLTTYHRICKEKGLDLPTMFQWDVTWEPRGEDLRELREFMEEEDRKDGD